MNDKVWVVTYYDIARGKRELAITCFKDKESATKYYEYLFGRHDIYVISIDECEVYPKGS